MHLDKYFLVCISFTLSTFVSAGDKIDLKVIVPIGGDPHLHETTPIDAIKVSEADVILVNGLTFEGWINELIENAGSSADVKLITEGVTPISSTVYKNASAFKKRPCK